MRVRFTARKPSAQGYAWAPRVNWWYYLQNKDQSRIANLPNAKGAMPVAVPLIFLTLLWMVVPFFIAPNEVLSLSISYRQEEQTQATDNQGSTFTITLRNISPWVVVMSDVDWRFWHPRISFKSIGERPAEHIVLLPLETYTHVLQVILEPCYEGHVCGPMKLISVTMRADVSILGRSAAIEVKAQNW